MKCFFNLATLTYDPDLLGVEVATIEEARIKAARYLGEVIRDRPGMVWAGEEVRIEVTNKKQVVLFTVAAFGMDASSTAA
ncbi:hypothetical protein [Sphingomonas sp. GV3]|uniref:DUF6894 family protein n=1 Tax=Sphingomonas sp. GV3 TaxID=3040671 RepID=UPI0035B5897B